jgi:hypothetical protein
MWEVMIACVIMHNMIVEEERDYSIYDQGWDFQDDFVAANPVLVFFRNFSIHIIRFETGQPPCPL